MIELRDASKTAAADILRGRGKAGADVEQTVREVLRDVRERGDAAVLDYTERFDGVRLADMRVTRDEMERGAAVVDARLLDVMGHAAENIRAFHQNQLRRGFAVHGAEGVVMGQKITPLRRVGVYVPGGTAAYPSTVLMDVIPAKIAGVEEVVMVTPPGRDGAVAPAVLAAARLAGVSAVYKVGGAQAIGALCCGTQSIPRVDKIVGPGNIYVAAAKSLVYGSVDIDMMAGPSDVLIVADKSASAAFVAADMLAQAEHDPHASAVLVSVDRELAVAVDAELERQLPTLERRDIARQSLLNNGYILIAEDMGRALELANELAPEHLELCVDDPFALLGLVRNAGSIFLGHYTPEALGDYFAGPNHTLPTGGTARFHSPLSVDDFTKKSSYLYYSREALGRVEGEVRIFAQAEGLTAHAASVAVRGGRQPG